METFDHFQKQFTYVEGTVSENKGIREPELGGFSCLPVNYYQTKGGGGISKF